MIIVRLVIEVEVVYDTEDTEIIEVELRANGTCKNIDKSNISNGKTLDRYLLDVKMDSLTWDKKEYSHTVNKCINEHIQNNHREIYFALCSNLVEKYENKQS